MNETQQAIVWLLEGHVLKCTHKTEDVPPLYIKCVGGEDMTPQQIKEYNAIICAHSNLPIPLGILLHATFEKSTQEECDNFFKNREKKSDQLKGKLEDLVGILRNMLNDENE